MVCSLVLAAFTRLSTNVRRTGRFLSHSTPPAASRQAMRPAWSFFAPGTDTSRQRYSLMYEPLPMLVESSIQIAWDYLERTGELGNPEAASKVLFDTIEMLIRHGERRKILLANKAIDAYKRFRAERHLELVS
jgi:hypothetical protein